MSEYPTETYLPLDVQTWLCQYLTPGQHAMAFAAFAAFVVVICLTAAACVCRSPDAAEE